MCIYNIHSCTYMYLVYLHPMLGRIGQNTVQAPPGTNVLRVTATFANGGVVEIERKIYSGNACSVVLINDGFALMTTMN